MVFFHVPSRCFFRVRGVYCHPVKSPARWTDCASGAKYENVTFCLGSALAYSLAFRAGFPAHADVAPDARNGQE